MNILGLSCHYHDAAACRVIDGALSHAAQEERFDRRKNSAEFPLRAANACVQAAGASLMDLDAVGFYEKPYLKFLRVLTGHVRAFPWSYPAFIRTIPRWLQDRLVLPLLVSSELGFDGDVLFINHHLSHAASAFLPSPFERAAIITCDGVGEWATTSIGSGEGSRVGLLKELRYPSSLGLLYSAVTTYLGFKANEQEGTVMGLAAQGRPRFAEGLSRVVDLAPDGSFRVDQRYLGINRGLRMYSRRFVKLFGPERQPGAPLEERHADMAASLQQLVEQAVVALARHAHEVTGLPDLCLAGGTFLNCVANSRIQQDAPFERVFIQPAAGDAGGALGVALYLSNCLYGEPRGAPMAHAYLGPEYSNDQIRRAIHVSQLEAALLRDDELEGQVAGLLARGKVVGWFQGRMEFGPRALGNRSILADPRDPAIKQRINTLVKQREPFRPFSPVLPEERAAEFFELSGPSPFMLLAPRVRPEAREAIPAVIHDDGTARVQTVSRQTNPRLHSLLGQFEALSGVPVLLNTSFNRRGEPLVCTPDDALCCYRDSGMEALVMGNYLLEKMT